jgi:two-component system sensor kinase FixL
MPDAIPPSTPHFQFDDFKLLMESLTLCVIIHDAKSKSILWANASACSVLGFTLEELLPLKAPDMSSSADKYRREIGREWLHGAVTHGINVIEWCYRAKNGDDILSEATATLVKLAQQDVVMVQFRDIASEEQVKREMKRLESRLKEFMQDSDEGLIVLRPDAAIEYISDAGRKLLGIEPGQTLPSRFTDLCDPLSRASIMEVLAVALPESISFPLRYSIEHSDGSVHWHQGTCRHIEIEHDLTGHLLHFRDITEQVEAENLRRLDQNALEYLARYNAMGEMAMAIAHELSQPLAAIGNFLEGAIVRLEDASAPRAGIAWGLESAVRQVDHAATIIKSVREYVVKLERAEAAADLNDIVSEVRYFIETKARESQVQVEIVLCAAALPVSCEKVLIGQVILNFAFNAIEEMTRFAPPLRRICISTERLDGTAVLQVQDDGGGIDAVQHQRLFDGFFSSKISGNGIGLALCKNIISRHRGDIWAQAADVRGAIFCFSLPLLK